MEFDNIETVKRAVEIDAGISIVPRGTITQEIASKRCRRADRRRRLFPSDRRDLQEEQGAFTGDEAVPVVAEGT